MVVVDFALAPQNYLLPGSALIAVRTGDGITLREEHADDLAELERGSIDFYAALRNAYLAQREAQIQGGTLVLSADYDPLYDPQP